MCLEFSRVALPILENPYDIYSFKVLPWLGGQIANDRESYQYLAESIRKFPDQEAISKNDYRMLVLRKLPIAIYRVV